MYIFIYIYIDIEDDCHTMRPQGVSYAYMCVAHHGGQSIYSDDRVSWPLLG